MRRSVRRASPPVVVLAAALLLSACGSSNEGTSRQDRSAGPVLANVLMLDFEQARDPLGEGATIRDAVPGGPAGIVVLGGAATQPLALVKGRGERGQGVAFPAPCPASPEPTCPKAIIEVQDDPDLVPGADAYEWGASLRLTTDETSKGSNIVQKGFSIGEGSQWKLQVDGKNGHPSCVVVGGGDTQRREVYADVTVADGGWHDVSCRREGTELVVRVDGGHRKSTIIPADLSITPAGPVRIGGKSNKPNNDQYFGVLDNVYVAAPS